MSVLSEKIDLLSPPCGSEAYLSFCQSLGSKIPVCEAVLKTAGTMPMGLSFPGEARFVDFFEAAPAILGRAKFIAFKDTSFSMFPVIRPGDYLKVMPVSVEDTQVNEVVVFHRRGRVYCHRVVAKRQFEKGQAVITRPDTSETGEDEPVFGPDLIGKVINVIRGKKILVVDKKSSRSFATTLDDSLFILTTRASETLREIFIAALKLFQSAPLYKKTGCWLIRSKPSSISYSLLYPTNPTIESRFFKSIPLKEFSGDLSRCPKWHLTAHFFRKKAGFASVVYRPGNCPYSGWWISDFYVRRRFRRLGLGGLLLKETMKLLKQSGADLVSVFYENRHPEMEPFWLKSGFLKKVHPETGYATMTQGIYGNQNSWR